MRTVLVASVRHHARRYLATSLAIVIAVAFMVAVDALGDAARSGVERQAAEQLRGIDVVTEWPGDAAAAARVAEAFAADPAVSEVATSWGGYGPVRSGSRSESMSIDTVADDPASRWQEVVAGRAPRTVDEVLVDAGRLADLGVGVGDVIRVGEGADARDLTVSGVAASTGGPRSGAVYVTPATAERLAAWMTPSLVTGRVTGADPATVASRLEATLDGAAVEPGAVLAERIRLSATDGIDVMQRLLLGFVAVAVLVGTLVIANTFAIVLAQRTRDLALLRCVGAVRGQVVRSVLAEAAVLALVSALVGVGAGLGLAAVVAGAAERWAPTVPLDPPTLSLAGALLPVAVALVITLLACWAPARRASRLSPLAALRPTLVPRVRSGAGALRIGTGLVLLVSGGAALVVASSGQLLAGLAGGTASFLGVLLLLPVVVPRLVQAVGSVAGRGVASRLAVANARRNPRRTAATTSALLVGVTLVVTTVVATATGRAAVAGEMDASHPVDVTVTAPDGPLAASVVERLGDLDGVDEAASLRGADVTIGEYRGVVLGADTGAWDLVRGDAAAPAADEVLLPYDAQLFDVVEEGGSVAVQVDGRSRELTARYTDGLGSPVVAAGTLTELAPDTATRAAWLRAVPDTDPSRLFDQVVSAAGEAPAVAGGLAQRADVDEELDLMLSITLGLLAVAVAIAVVGIGNTLGLSVLERLHENALLRALGLTARGLRATLAVEAVLMALVAAGVGLALGVTYAWFGVQAVGAELFDDTPTVVVPWTQVAGIVLAAVVAGLAASVLPARRAAAVAPVSALG